MQRHRIYGLLLLGGGLLAACSEAPAPAVPQEPAAARVIVEPLRVERARTTVEAVGTSQARLSAEIYPVTAGEVVAVNFEPGQFVRAGDVLVQLDSREEELAVRLAKLQLEDAERLYERYERSADSGAVVPTVLDEARTAMEAARLDLERAKIALEDRSMRAVFDGHVGTNEVDIGDRVNPNTLITTLDDRSFLLVTFDVPEAFIGELGPGDSVALGTWSAKITSVGGEIVDTGSRIDPETRTFVARARVDNGDDRLRPGMSFRVALDVPGPVYPVVSETGVQWGADGAFVWSVVDGQARRTPVQVVQRRNGRVLVDASLEPGDIVVVEGIQRMRNGIDVTYDTVELAGEDAAPVAITSTGAD